MQNHSNAVILWNLKLRDMSGSSEMKHTQYLTETEILKNISATMWHCWEYSAVQCILITTTLHYIYLYPIVYQVSRALVFRDDPHSFSVQCWLTVPATARSKPYVCGRSLAGVASSNPARSIGVCLLWVLCVLSGRGVCYGLITRPEKSHWMWWV
jgi:hypothetical protein